MSSQEIFNEALERFERLVIIGPGDVRDLGEIIRNAFRRGCCTAPYMYTALHEAVLRAFGRGGVEDARGCANAALASYYADMDPEVKDKLRSSRYDEAEE